MCLHSFAHMYMDAPGTTVNLPRFFSTLVFETERLTKPGAHWFSPAGWPVSCRYPPPTPDPSSRVSYTVLHPGFYVVMEDLNSGPLAHTTELYWLSRLPSSSPCSYTNKCFLGEYLQRNFSLCGSAFQFYFVSVLFVTGSDYVVQLDPNSSLLIPPPKCWDYSVHHHAAITFF